MAFIELNHVLEDGMASYPGLPTPQIGALLTHEDSGPRYEGKAEFYLGKVDMPCNVGTYLDSPFHRFPDAPDLSKLPLEAVAGLPGVVVDAGQPRPGPITVEPPADELAGRAILFRTGWDKRWGTDSYWETSPYLTRSLVDLLVSAGAGLVGVDFMNVDDVEDLSRPAHTQLLRANIPIVEHLCNLDSLPPAGFRFYAVPLRIVRGASFAVRAFAEVDG